jgi:hypothetical protein
VKVYVDGARGFAGSQFLDESYPDAQTLWSVTFAQRRHFTRFDYGSVLIVAIFLLAVSQALDGLQTPVGLVFRSVTVGLSIVCSLICLVLYGASARKT